jgi:c-di-GMP-binding flagellar brake protein YcgR
MPIMVENDVEVEAARHDVRTTRLTDNSQPPLRVGSATDIGVVHGGITRWFTTRVQTADLESGSITTDWPSQPGSWLALRPGELVQVAYTTRRSVFFADATLVSMCAEPPSALVIRLGDEWRKIERRQFQRFPISVPASIEGQPDDSPIAGTLEDVSMGGVRVSVDRQLRLRDRLNLCFMLPGSPEPMQIRTHVVRSAASDCQPTGLWTYGCQFDELLETDQARISRIVHLMNGVHSSSGADSSDVDSARLWWLQAIPILGSFIPNATSRRK